jgi:hypothetical protein
MQAFRFALGGNNGPGVMTPNEVRQKLNLGPSSDPKADELVGWNGAAGQTGQNGGPPLEDGAAPEPWPENMRPENAKPAKPSRQRKPRT